MGLPLFSGIFLVNRKQLVQLWQINKKTMKSNDFMALQLVVGGAYYGLEQALLQPEALWLNEFTKCMWPFMDIIWPLLGGFVLFGVAIGGVGCASSIRKHLKV